MILWLLFVPPRDEKIKNTILYIIASFFQSLPNAAIYYVCDSADKSQIGRKKWFEKWFLEYEKTGDSLFEKQDDEYKAILVRTINQGNEIFNDILSFETLNQDETSFDETTNPFFVGSLNDCFKWIEFNYGVNELKFVPHDNLKIIYAGLVKKGVFHRKKT